ncbi:acyltransferase family protein [Bordetella genomosp. 13]|uniref:acyltransferase family protein n=1 Tax=Bordetella genomosp. 13 TaxID=463040 RepID=UPI00119F84AD|nr:acyltransferase [Bordetella genomosp. 13]
MTPPGLAHADPAGKLAGTVPIADHYLPALDGLRAISILLVMVAHMWLSHIVPGGLGVTIFFFISGFIITRVLLREHGATGRIGIGAFYGRRALRLLPALYVFVLASLAAMLAAGSPIPWPDVLAAVLHYANYWSLFPGAFPAWGNMNSPLGITWSLAVEEHYYLIYPFLLAWLLPRPGRLMALLGALIVAVLAWRLYLALHVGLDALPAYRIYKSTDTRVDSILYGALYALLWSRCDRFARMAGTWPLFALGLALMLVSLLLRDPVFRETWRYSLQGVALAAMFAWLALRPSRGSRLLSHPLLVYIGRISYSLYLYHWLALVCVEQFMPESPLPARMAAVSLASFGAAHLSYRYVERLGQRWRRRFGL